MDAHTRSKRDVGQRDTTSYNNAGQLKKNHKRAQTTTNKAEDKNMERSNSQLEII